VLRMLAREEGEVAPGKKNEEDRGHSVHGQTPMNQ